MHSMNMTVKEKVRDADKKNETAEWFQGFVT